MYERLFIDAIARSRKHALVLGRPSQAVPAIEGFIGCDFGHVPIEATTTPINKFGLKVSTLFDRHLRNELKGYSDDELGGQYLPTYHLCLINPDSTDMVNTRIHEAAHGLARNINPLASRIMQARLGIFEQLFRENPVFIELRATYQCIQEGFATWVADSITGPTWGINTTPELLTAIFHRYKEVVDNEITKVILDDQTPSEYPLGVKYAPYLYGAYFVSNVVSELERSGMERYQAVKLLLDNSPRNLSELSDPENYAFKLQYFPDTETDNVALEAAAKILLAS